MVKFRTLGGEVGGKGFGLLAMETTFDLPLPLSVVTFMGVQTLDVQSDCPANKKPQTNGLVSQSSERARQIPRNSHLIGQPIKTMALCCTSRERDKSSTLFSLISEPINSILLLCHGLVLHLLLKSGPISIILILVQH